MSAGSRAGEKTDHKTLPLVLHMIFRGMINLSQDRLRCRCAVSARLDAQRPLVQAPNKKIGGTS